MILKLDNKQLIKFMKRNIKLCPRNKGNTDKYKCFEELVLDKGIPFKTMLIGKYTLMESKMCVRNAYTSALRYKSLTYVEGFAFCKTIGSAIHHAWCIDKDNNVIDVTWEDGIGYYGIPMSDVYIKKVRKSQGREWGILDNVRYRFPTLKGEQLDFEF